MRAQLAATGGPRGHAVSGESTGPRGRTGSRGPTGRRGATGSRGPTGATGAPGAPGAPGAYPETLPAGKTLRGVWAVAGLTGAETRGVVRADAGELALRPLS